MANVRTIFRIRTILFLLLISLALASCGGGGGDGTPSPQEECRSKGGDFRNGQCCTASACGSVNGNLICKTAGGNGWLPAGDYVGQIINLGCGEAVSSGAWNKCAGFDRVSVSRGGKTHQYICIGSAISECTGEQSPISGSGRRYQTGYSLSRGGSVFYCASDASWTTNLDTKDAISCEKAGFIWTNSLCCSEADDRPSEYYNDPGGTGLRRGACWNSGHMDDGFFPTQDDPKASFSGDVLNYKGEFLGCDVGDTETGLENSALLGLRDRHKGTQLINNNEVCTVLQDAKGPADFFCSIKGLWTEINLPEPQALEPRVIKTISWTPEEGDRPSECCPALDCWNGKECVKNQKSTAKDETTKGLRCIDGEWIAQDIKYTWDFFKKGFCAEETDCLVNPEGNAENDYSPEKYFIDHPQNDPQCISERQYILDNVCGEGKWASRTGFIALQLMDSAPESYELFCGKYEDVLNYVEYESLLGAGTVREYIADTCTKDTENINCANNFCVIRYEDETGPVTAFGASLNSPIEGPQSFLKALGKDTVICSGVSGEEFGECAENTYYSKDFESIIVHPKGISGKSINELRLKYGETISSEKEKLDEYASMLTTDTDFTFFTRLAEARNIYYAQKGAKKAFGIYVPDIFDDVGGVFRSVIGLQFEGVDVEDEFGIDACDLVRSYHTAKGADISTAQVHCEKNEKMQMIAFGTGTEFPLGEVWRDLTAKLRLK